MTTEPPVGLIAAIPEEAEHLRDVPGRIIRVGGLAFETTTLDGTPAVIVETGIGKVNAAVTATLLCERFGCRALLFGGVAGGLDPTHHVGDVVIGTTVVQHDYGALVDGGHVTYQPGTIPFPDRDRSHGYHVSPSAAAALADIVRDLRLPPLPASIAGDAPRRPTVSLGRILTGDTFVNDERARARLHAAFAAQAVEMEGGAVAQVAERFGIPWVVVRCLSDLAGSSSHVDFRAFLPVAAANAAAVVRAVVRHRAWGSPGGGTPSGSQ
jgi:adenosylhomocysteine nucleosidase